MNTKLFLYEVITLLENSAIPTWIFGGWAEELLGIIKPRKHKDVDLLYPAEDFKMLETFLSKHDHFQEVKEKHFNHKRAFIYKDVLVELLLVQNDNGKLFTNFWGKNIYYWPTNMFRYIDGYRIASKMALLSYRKNHKKLMENSHITSNI